MKMTKIESARIVYKEKGHCFKVTSCFGCFNEKWCESRGCYQSDKYLYEKVALAKAYIKRHESKSRKKDHIRDTTKKVEEPKPIKTVGIDNSDVTLAQHEPVKDCPANSETPQPIKFEDEVPEYVYIVYASVIRCYVVIGGFKKVIDKNLDGSIRETFTIYAVPMTEERGEWLDAKGCYRTLEEAVIVAKKLWNGDGK